MARRETSKETEMRLWSALREKIQFENFRVGQLEAACAVLNGLDVVVKADFRR